METGTACTKINAGNRYCGAPAVAEVVDDYGQGVEVKWLACEKHQATVASSRKRFL